MSQLYVKTHVARDLLQNAALFKTDKLAVWEYVSNSLQYVDPGMNPVVKVTLDNRRKRIIISDNGRGMDWDGLQNFFVMHGENLDRKKGKAGRGRFGTGKSAAFGIADVLRITTVRNRKRSRVELWRRDVDKMASEDPIPVKVLGREVPTNESNRTTIEIEKVHLKSLDQKGIIEYIERHLAKWPKNVTIFVNNHECEYTEPPIANQRSFRPEGMINEKLGDVELIIKESKKPLEKDLRGVSIYSKGVWQETTLAGSEGREMSQYLFGEIDVPKLDEDDSPIPSFDLSRSMKLNPSNELVQAIYAFIGQKVEEVRRELVKKEKRRLAQKEAKKLAKQANEIAQVINEDFRDFRQRVAKARAKARGARDLGREDIGGGVETDDLVFGSEVPAEIMSETGGLGSSGEGESGDTEPKELNPQVIPGSPHAEKKGKPAGGAGKGRRLAGGFNVDFKNMGEAESRALYAHDEHTIFVNLDHPQVIAAKKLSSIDDPIFRRLAYEIAFSEYAIALAALLEKNNQLLDPTDAIFEIRETLNRVTRKAANLYAE
ncbi:ATP-binding protein [bacterium]|nr:ATP-binding protein [bacterium]